MADFEEKLGSILSNTEAMNQIMSLAKSFGGESAQTQPVTAEVVEEDEAPTIPAFSLSDLDPRLIQLGMKALGAYSKGDDKRVALLNALRPFVKPQRYAKVDRAIQIAKISRVIRVALDAFGGGEEHV